MGKVRRYTAGLVSPPANQNGRLWNVYLYMGRHDGCVDNISLLSKDHTGPPSI